jgi:hypothetical protein
MFGSQNKGECSESKNSGRRGEGVRTGEQALVVSECVGVGGLGGGDVC